MGCDFRFVHIADLHLGSRFKGISSADADLGRRMYESIFDSLRRIVDTASELSDFMVIAGDVYDEASMTPRTRYRFAREMERYGKPVFVVRGNHDFGDRWEDTVPYPENVRMFPSAGDTYTLTINGFRINITGISYSEWHTVENLAQRMRGTPGGYNIGLLHCSVREVAESEEYAPCSVSDMVGKGIDYWALGHIHKRILVRDSNPVIAYPGNIQGRNPREIGEKGCLLVSVDRGNTSVEFIPTQGILWDEIDADITGIENIEQLAESVTAVPDSFLGMRFTGSGPLDAVIRRDPEGVASMLGNLLGCRVLVRGISTMPEMGAEEMSTGLLAEVMSTGKGISSMTLEELTAALCTGPAADIRNDVLELLTGERYGGCLEEAVLELIARVSEERP